ncbi:hypothetical protein N7462_004866 [Penicillium macrosclerotiorum]|nr:hypothetical protein N7462_004866 [Penicillium macrosclerotiorum]
MCSIFSLTTESRPSLHQNMHLTSAVTPH